MAWIKVPGLAGKVYAPDDADGQPRKHPCKSCFSCQWCDENRCQVCRADPSGAGASGRRCAGKACAHS